MKTFETGDKPWFLNVDTSLAMIPLFIHLEIPLKGKFSMVKVGDIEDYMLYKAQDLEFTINASEDAKTKIEEALKQAFPEEFEHLEKSTKKV